MRRIAVVLLVACNGVDTPEESAEDTVETETEYQGCEEVTIFVDGPTEPVVGDSWTVLLKCDGGPVMGPMVLRFDPNDFASLSENVATFKYAGTATMKVQVGALRQEMEVTVTDSR